MGRNKITQCEVMSECVIMTDLPSGKTLTLFLTS